MRFLFLSLGLGLLAAITGAPGVPAASMPAQFYETTAVTDTPDDFVANGALDIVAVHVAEKYSFDLDESVGRETVQFRLQLRNRDEIQATAGQTNVTYVLGYKVAGTATELSAEVTVTCSMGLEGGFVCSEPRIPKPHSTQQDFGVTFILDAAPNGLALLPRVKSTD